MKDLEENANLLRQMVNALTKQNKQLEDILEKQKKEKSELLEALEEKEKALHKTKLNGIGECQKGCDRYNKSMDDVVEACAKHKKAVTSLKDIAEELKKKNLKLKKLNEELQEKVEILDEDTDHSVRIIRNLQDEMLKLRLEYNENKENLTKKEVEFIEVEKEKKEIENKFGILKNKFKNCLQENQKLEITRTANTELLVSEINALKNMTPKCTVEKNTMTDDANHMEEQGNLIKVLDDKVETLEQRIVDLVDELQVKTDENKTLEETMKKMNELQTSSKSLDEEFKLADLLKCKDCEERFENWKELEDHAKTIHEVMSEKEIWKAKQYQVEQKQNQIKLKLSSSLFTLKKKEDADKHSCRCRTFCRIHHKKHNFKKSISEDIFKKLQSLSREIQVCHDCEKGEKSVSNLKYHQRCDHLENSDREREKWGSKNIQIPILISGGSVKD